MADMDGEDLVKVGMEVALRPLTEIAENALGLLGGDWLSEKRRQRREKLKIRTEKILHDRGAKMDTDPSPSIAVPLISAAQDEDRDILADMWARLTATALDPATSKSYRREFVDIAKQLEPIDVLVLPFLEDNTEMRPSRREVIASRLSDTTDRVQLAFQNLERLQLIEHGRNPVVAGHPFVSTLGREFLKAVK
jgi:hypothetical protein